MPGPPPTLVSRPATRRDSTPRARQGTAPPRRPPDRPLGGGRAGRRAALLASFVAGARGRRAIWGLAAALTLAGCDPWRCDFQSHGACVEFVRQPADLADAQRRVDRLLELELPYWGLANLDGWRIQYRDTAQYTCYLADRNDGCTDFVEKTLSVRLPQDVPDCFEAAELLHELGHYELGDPMHSSPRWDGVDAQFAGIVWDRPDAPPECVERFHGITSGVWTVRRDSF